MSDKAAIIVGTIIVVAIILFTSWQSLNMRTELERERMDRKEAIERERMEFEKAIAREKIELERERLKRQRQSEEP